MSEQNRHNGSNEGDACDAPLSSVEHIGAPGDERGSGQATPLPTRWYPNPILV